MMFWKKCECGEWFLARNGDRGRPRICCERCHFEVRRMVSAEIMRAKRTGQKACFSSDDALAEIRRRKREAERARLAANEWEHVEWRGNYGYVRGSVK